MKHVAPTTLFAALAVVACGSTTETNPPPPEDTGTDSVVDGPADTSETSDSGECTSDVAPKPGTVITDRGAVTGALSGKTWSYKNVPFAAPPIGPLRWKPPVPATCWKGERDAKNWGTICPQLTGDGTGPIDGNEDCLQLNVWTPQDPPKSPLPVLFWIHGGGHQVGGAPQLTSGVRLYDGQSVVEKGNVIVVATNYRLGSLGFLAHPLLTAENADKSSGMYGHLDQVAALQWVQKNIAAFGGDPKRVMIAGESAGGVSVCSLIASPLAKGLFTSAVMQSGGCPGKTLADAETFGTKVFDAAKCQTAPDPLACMRALPFDQVVKALPVRVDVAGVGAGYSSVVDGYALKGVPIDVIASGAHNHVPWILGTNSDETSRTVPLKPAATDAEYQAAVKLLGGAIADAVLAEYPSSDYASPFAAYVALTSDAKFICHARKVARAAIKGQKEPVYRYVLSHTLDNAPLLKVFGAWHGVDVLYLFDHVAIAGYTPSAGEKSLVDAFIGYWSRHATTGDPNAASAVAWPKYDATDPYLRLDTTIAADVGVRTKQCDFWDTILK